MRIVGQTNILDIWMQTIYMVRQWANIYLIVDLNGSVKMKLINSNCLFLSCPYAFQSKSTLYSCLRSMWLQLDANAQSVWLNGWVFVYELNGCGFDSICSHIGKFCLNLPSEDSSDGYILEVGLKYSNELHELHDYYPLTPGKFEINHNILSKHCSNIANKYGTIIGRVNRLFPNLGNKSKIIFHYRNLQLYLLVGMKLVIVHRILKFKQSHWLKRYIDFNTDKRKILPIVSKKTYLN